MPTLLIRHGHGNHFVSERHTERVPLARQNNEQHFARFGCFIQQSDSLVWSKLAGLQKVKINNVFGFSQTNGYIDTVYYGYDVVALGYYSRRYDTVSVPLFDGFPLVWCELRIVDGTNNPPKHSNVVDLFPGNSKRSYS